MLPTRNTMDGDSSDTCDKPTIVNFMMALGEATDCVDVDAVKKFTNRNVLSISSRWSKEISQQRKCEDSMGSYSIDGDLDNIDQSFSSECAELEVEAISVLASLESEMERACIPMSLRTNFDEEDDDDDFSEELLRLEESEQLLKEDLSRIDVLKSETKRQDQKGTIDNSCLQYNEILQIRLDGASKATSSKFRSHALQKWRKTTQISSCTRTQ